MRCWVNLSGCFLGKQPVVYFSLFSFLTADKIFSALNELQQLIIFTCVAQTFADETLSGDLVVILDFAQFPEGRAV